MTARHTLTIPDGETLMSRVKISAAQMKALGLPVYSAWPDKKAPKLKAPAVTIDQHSVFEAACKAHKLPKPIPEYQFAPPRRWRADYAFMDLDLLVEIEGGLWVEGGGRHTRGEGFCRDLEKYKAALVEGWYLLRVTPDQVWKTGQAFEWIREVAVSMGWG